MENSLAETNIPDFLLNKICKKHGFEEAEFDSIIFTSNNFIQLLDKIEKPDENIVSNIDTIRKIIKREPELEKDYLLIKLDFNCISTNEDARQDDYQIMISGFLYDGTIENKHVSFNSISETNGFIFHKQQLHFYHEFDGNLIVSMIWHENPEKIFNQIANLFDAEYLGRTIISNMLPYLIMGLGLTIPVISNLCRIMYYSHKCYNDKCNITDSSFLSQLIIN